MRTNKPAIIWSAILSAVSLAVSIITYSVDFMKCEYISTLFSGVFASGILALLIAIINYRSERRKTLEKFYSYARKAAVNFNKFEYGSNIERSMDSVLQINQFDYVELDNAYGDIEFIFKDKAKRKYIYDKIYKPILDCRNLITEKTFHFMEFKKSTNGNRRVMQMFLDEIAEVLLIQKEQKMFDVPGYSSLIKTVQSRLSAQIMDELNGEFYKIMYPYSKEDTNNAD